jgi:pyruvate,water dikinase
MVSERRRAWARWREVAPPAVIGTPSTPEEAPTAEPSAATAPNAAGAATLRGSPASRGVVTGPARIIRTPDEGAARLRSGDILVCVASTPAWTPLFAIVAGVISETGGALSHPAITAREYGIPAVVSVKDATATLRDGQLVTLDGSAGTVMLAT